MNGSFRPESASAPLAPAALIARARRGERSALEALIRCYQTPIARFVVSETGDDAHFEDICQTVFVKMVLSLPRLRDVERFEPWLYQIARNACRDHLRRRRFWRSLFVSYEPGHDAMCAPMQERHVGDGRIERVELAVAALPASQRKLLELSLERPRSYGELSALSRASVSSVKSRLYRAREALREALLKEQSE